MTTTTQAIKQLRDIHTSATMAKSEADKNYGNKQQQYAKHCAALSLSMSSTEFEKVCDGIDTGDKNVLKSKTKCWGHPHVAPKVDAIFAAAVKLNPGESSQNVAYALASKIKKGDAKTVKGAADLYKAGKAEKSANDATPLGMVTLMKSSIKARAKKLQYNEDQLQDIFAACDALALTAPQGDKPAPAPEVAPVEEAAQADTQLAQTTDANADADIEALMATLTRVGASEGVIGAAIANLVAG